VSSWHNFFYNKIVLSWYNFLFFFKSICFGNSKRKLYYFDDFACKYNTPNLGLGLQVVHKPNQFLFPFFGQSASSSEATLLLYPWLKKKLYSFWLWTLSLLFAMDVFIIRYFSFKFDKLMRLYKKCKHNESKW